MTIEEKNELRQMIIDPDFLKSHPEYDTMLSDMVCMVKEMKDKKYLDRHNHTIEYSQSNKRWYTRVDKPEGTYDGHSHKYQWLYGKTQAQLEQKIIDFYKSLESYKTVEDVFNEWLDLRLEYGEIQRSTYDRTKTCFSRFFIPAKMNTQKINCVTESQLTVFIKKSIHENELTSKAWQDLRGVIAGIFKYAYRNGYTLLKISGFFDDLVLPRNMFKKSIHQDSDQIFTDYEVQRILNWICETEDRKNSLSNLGIIIAMTTGLRAGELSTLKPGDFKGNVLRVSRTEIRYKEPDGKNYVFEVRENTKGRDGIREIAVPDITLEVVKKIRELNPKGEYLFMHDGERMKGDRFSGKLKRICGYLNIKPRSLHKLRKTYASILLDSGFIPEKVITKQMGHTSITTTNGFYHFDRHQKDEKIELIETAMAPISDMFAKASGLA